MNFLLVVLLSSFTHPTVGDNDNLRQYTPEKSDWTTFQTKIPGGNHSPDAISWLARDQWEEWNGEVYDPTEYSRSEFANLICPAGGNTVRGLYELFYDTKPFDDDTNPTKAEVDNWHKIVLKHIRAMVGYDESEYPIEPDTCLHVRALFSQERHRTNIWDTKYPENTCVGSTNAHCGAGFVPSFEDQQDLGYLPDDTTFCEFITGGSEGITSAGKASIPWSIKWVRPFCSFLGSEGFWGGHVGPFFTRSKFGWSWRDMDPNNQNSNTQVRLKWGGKGAAHKYENPLTGKLLINVTEPFGVNPSATYESYECLLPDDSDFETYFTTAANATDCYRQVIDEDKCGKRFLTFGESENSDGTFGCACYPPEMETCDSIGRPDRRTWDFRPVSYNFGGISVDVTKDFTRDNLPWINRECKNAKYVTNAASVSQCLEKLVEADFKFCVDGFQFDCERNLMTWNANADSGETECACYPINSHVSKICIKGELRRNGRQTYALDIDPSFIPDSSIAPPKDLSCPTRSPTLSPLPSAMPSQAPSTSIIYFDGYYIDTTEELQTVNKNTPNRLKPWEGRICPGAKAYFRGYPDKRDCVKYLVEKNFQVEYNGNPFPCSKTLLTYIPEKSECVFNGEGTENCAPGDSLSSSGRETYEIKFDVSVISATPTALPTTTPTPLPTTVPTPFPTQTPTAPPPTTSSALYNLSSFKKNKGSLWLKGKYDINLQAIVLQGIGAKKKKMETKKNKIPSPSEGVGYTKLQVKLDVEYISLQEYERVKLQLDAFNLKPGNEKKSRNFLQKDFKQRTTLVAEFTRFELLTENPWLRLTLKGKKVKGILSHEVIVREVEINLL